MTKNYFVIFEVSLLKDQIGLTNITMGPKKENA